jgi:malonyl-CoA decarboxylase
LAEALVSERGEASGAALAHALHLSYSGLEAKDREGFQVYIAEHFSPDQTRLSAAAKAYLEEPGSQQAMELATAAEPPRQELLRRMNMAPEGTAALVGMRKDLLGRLTTEPDLKPLEADLRHLLSSWFNRGFLELRRIDWHTPAAILEKLIAYEAVHEIQGWEDLRRRLAPDRRCFGFFHPTLRDEPLIFVEVALVKGIAGAIQPLLDRNDSGLIAGEIDTAIFYSISNCQEGLRGISFGNFLIKQVVEELKAELRNLRRFATLSPVPGFAKWLDKQQSQDNAGRIGEELVLLAAAEMPSIIDPVIALNSLVQKNAWWREPALAAALQPILTRLCAVYLTTSDGSKGPADPVARFHLGNGARLERINWLGNTSARGMRESLGLMVNYLYDPDFIEINHESFVHQGAVARSADVDALLLSPVAKSSECPASAPRGPTIAPLARLQKRKRRRHSAAEPN